MTSALQGPGPRRINPKAKKPGNANGWRKAWGWITNLLPGSGPAGAESTPLDVTQLLAGTTAVIGVLASLAVTGVLGQAQRNHPSLIYVCLGLVLAAALLWSWAAVVPGRQHPWLHLVGVVCFVAGLSVGITALVTTQHDSERPAVTASFDKDKRLLTATITADGLSLNKALVVKITSVKAKMVGRRPNDRKPKYKFDGDTKPLYFGVVGPDASGKVNVTAIAFVPANTPYVGVKAWDSKQDEPSCTGNKKQRASVSQHDEAGCFLLQMPAPAR